MNNLSNSAMQLRIIQAPSLKYNRLDCQLWVKQLSAMTQACINLGASIGFLPSSSSRAIQNYWWQVFDAVIKSQKTLIIAELNGVMAGCVQLSPATKDNAQHRAEVEKLLVHPNSRRKGVATKLMQAIEQESTRQQISLLVLDTQSDSDAEILYQSLGFKVAGQIPHFVSDERGDFHATTYYYKLLAPTLRNRIERAAQARYVNEY